MKIWKKRNVKNKNIVNKLSILLTWRLKNFDNLNVNFEENNTNYQRENKILSPHCVVEAKVEKEVVVASQWFNSVDLVRTERTLSTPFSSYLSLSNFIHFSISFSTSFSTSFYVI